MLYTVICDLFGSTVFFHNISSVARFKNVTENKMCVLVFCTTFVRNISHSKKKWARYDKNVYWFSCKLLVPVRNLNFLDRFSKNTHISYFIKKNLPMGIELLPVDRRTERHDAASSRFPAIFWTRLKTNKMAQCSAQCSLHGCTHHLTLFGRVNHEILRPKTVVTV